MIISNDYTKKSKFDMYIDDKLINEANSKLPNDFIKVLKKVIK